MTVFTLLPMAKMAGAGFENDERLRSGELSHVSDPQNCRLENGAKVASDLMDFLKNSVR